MSVLARKVALVVLVTLVTGLACGAVAGSFAGPLGFRGAVAATLVSLPVGIAAVALFFRLGLSAEAVVWVTLLRVGLSLAGAGILAGLFESLRTPVFFLAVAVIYLVNLVVETWLVYRENQRSSGLFPSL